MAFVVSAIRPTVALTPDRLVTQHASLAGALNEACTYLASGMIGVLIEDALGNQIGSPELDACCRGEKRLSDDLKAK